MFQSREELATLLQNAAKAVLAGDSPEGSLYWKQTTEGGFEISYNIRVGQNDGRVSVVGN